MGIFGRFFAVIIPGGAAALRRRYLQAAIIFTVWAIALEGFLLIRIVAPEGLGQGMERLFLWTAMTLFLLHLPFGLLAAMKTARGRETRGEDLYSRALAAFLGGNDELAEKLLKKAMEKRPLDADCLFLRGQTALMGKRKHRARRYFRKCLVYDENGKWEREIQGALDASGSGST